MEKAQDRLEILEKIREYEKNGWFDRDVENDPPAPVLMPGQADYLTKKLRNKIMRKIALSVTKTLPPSVFVASPPVMTAPFKIKSEPLPGRLLRLRRRLFLFIQCRFGSVTAFWGEVCPLKA